MNNDTFVANVFNKINNKFELNDNNKTLLLNILYTSLKDCNIIYNEPKIGDFETIINLYCEDLMMQGLSEKTIKHKKYTLNELNRYIKKDIKDISLSDLRTFLTYKQEKVIENTLNSIITRIKAFFTWAYEEEYIDNNPSKRIRKIREPYRISKPLNCIEVEQIRETCKNNRDRAIIEFALSTGLRVSEIKNLNIKDIDFTNNRVIIIGKGNKERIAFFTDKAKYYLQKYLDTREYKIEDPLFIANRKPYKRLGARRIEIIVKELKDANNIEKKVTPHTFRKTMATNLLEGGADITVVQKLLGHVNINTTLIYAQTSMETVKYQYSKHLTI